MILSLLLSTASVVDAERAFAARAQVAGQWSAFRETAAPDAILFWPKPTNAHEALKGLKDPPKSVRWWPTKAWQSCDGTLAVTTGGALWPDGRHGWFTTVWKKQPDGGWKWVLDHGGYLDRPRPEPARLRAVLASCSPKDTRPPPLLHPYRGLLEADNIVASDYSLIVTWISQANGSREVRAHLAGSGIVLEDSVPAPSK